MLLTYHFAKRIKGIKIGAKLIEWGQNTKFSHCAVEIIEHPEGDAWIFESVYPKARRVPLGEWLKTYKPVESYSFIIDDPILAQNIKNKLYANLHKPYSVLQLVVIGVGIALKLLEKAINKITLNAKKYSICSEYMAEVQAEQGAKFDESVDLIDLLDVQAQAKKLKGL